MPHHWHHHAIVYSIVTGLVVGLLVTWYFSARKRLERAFVALPITKIRDAKHGEAVRVLGRLAVLDAIEAPFSKRRCAYYDAVVEERFVEAGEVRWTPLVRETAARPFTLTDPTGVARVETDSFETFVTLDHQKMSGELDQATAKAFLEKHGQELGDADRVLRYREGVLGGGERVSVLGRARWDERDGERKLVIEAGADGAVRASDDPSIALSGARPSMLPPGSLRPPGSR